MTWSCPPGDHSGWTRLSSGPASIGTGSPGRPAPSSSASQSVVRSQGMSGWSQLSQARWRAVGAGARIGEEVVPGGQHLALMRPALQGHSHQRVDGLAFAAMVLAHGQHALPRQVEHEVGVAQLAAALGRERHRRRSGCEAVDPLVRELDADHDAALRGERPAAILVHAGAQVERCRGQLGERAVRVAADQRHAAALERPAFGPVDADRRRARGWPGPPACR